MSEEETGINTFPAQEEPNYIEKLRKAGELSRNPNLLDVVFQDLDVKIKHDYPTKTSAFCTGLSGYTKNPLNLVLTGESSTGKTYNVVNVLENFPQEDIWYLGALSPTALIHDYGVLVDKNGREILPEQKPNKADFEDKTEYNDAMRLWRDRLKESKYVVDLQGKILVFLEPPHFKTFNMLLPILSHDKWEISYKITEKTESGKLRTAHIIVRGWPATIWLSTKPFMEEFINRCFVATPEYSPEKIREAHFVTATRFSEPWTLEERPSKSLIQTYIEVFKYNMKNYDGVLIPYAKFLAQKYYAEVGRDMRDFQHFLEFVSVIAAFHFVQRPIAQRGNQKFIVAIVQDFEVARDIFYTVFQTTRTGLQQRVINFYDMVICKEKEWSIDDLTKAHNQMFKPKKAKKTIYRYIQQLEDIGYVNVTEDPNDKKRSLVTPLILQKEIVSLCPIFENGIFLSLETQKALKNQLSELGHATQFYINTESKDDVGTIHKRQYQVLDANDLSKILFTKKQEVCPYLKKALEEWKRRKGQTESLKGQNIQSETNSRFEVVSRRISADSRNF